jgi:GT2 family glycosyltransferase
VHASDHLDRTGIAGTEPASVCAIVVTCNRKELLRETLTALMAQTSPVARVLVVDNASTDGTREIVEREFPQVVFLHLRRNVGGAGGFCAGMEWAYDAGCTWLWLLDDDTIVAPTALEELLKAHGRSGPAHCPLLLASKVLWTDGSLHYMNPSRAKLADLEALYASVAEATLSIRSTTFVSCLIDRSLVSRYGFPIADYFIWGDDTEYTARVLRDNFGVMVPASIAVHKTARKHTALDAPPERYYYHVRNIVWMLTRSDAWAAKEKVRFAITLVAWIGRYLRVTGTPLAALKVVAVALFDGLFSRPKQIDLKSLIAVVPAAQDEHVR